MAEPAKTQAQSRQRPPLDRLLASLAANAKHNAHEMIAGTADALRWGDLDRTVARFLKADVVIAAARMDAVTQEAERLLLRFDPTGERRRGYAETVASLERHADNGLPTLPVELVAVRLYESLLWYTAWHLFAAHITTTEVIRVLDMRPGQAPPRAFRMPDIPWERGVAAGREALKVAGTAAHHVAQRSKAGLEAYQTVRAERAAEAAEEAKRLRRDAEAAEIARQAEEASKREAADAATREAAPESSEPEFNPANKSATYPIPSIQLDSLRLRGSVVGTWLALVMLSWVSLIWGAMISLPIGIGAGVIAMAGVGVIAVPLWGTLWGFLGMGAARDSTLRQMGFKPAPKWSFISEITATYSKALGLPMPQVGTIPAFNAFAMGTSWKDATIAIGEPLTQRLTPAELAAVIGHELGHVVSGDMRRMMLMRTFQNATVWFALVQGVKQFARWIICWAAEMFILAFSRRREFYADAIGAALAGKEAMIGALRKLEQAPPMTGAENTHARFMFRALGSTHPSTAARIRALEQETYIRRLPQQIGRG